MSTELANTDQNQSLALSTPELVGVLKNSLYPGAADDSIKLVIQYCTAAGLDVFQKPVHIVPMWDNKAGSMRDVVMPGINLYRTNAARSNALAGIDEPEFGPDVTEALGGLAITYPAWCKVTVRRRLPTGEIGVFTGKELWKENYAVKGGKEKSIAPNAMWARRPYAQLAKCAQAQALRQAFPETCSAPTAEEMEGREHQIRDVTPKRQGVTSDPFPKSLPAPEPVRPWQDLYPHAWGDEVRDDGRTWGEIADGPEGETVMRAFWRDDPRSPVLCSWGAKWIVDTIPSVVDLEWEAIADTLPGRPETILHATPDELRKAAGYVMKARTAQDKADAERGAE